MGLDITDEIIEMVAKILKSDKSCIPIDEHLINIGFDSIDEVELSEKINEKHNVNFNANILDLSINDIIQKIIND